MPDGDPLPDVLALNDTPPHAERILSAIAALQAEVRAIRAALERERIAAPLSRMHLAAAMPLLAEISAAIGDSSWRVAQLFDHAMTRDPQLRAAITAAVGPLDDGASRRVGRLLGRCEGVALPDRYRVERVDDGPSYAALWRVLKV